jgi:hypothetical protein
MAARPPAGIYNRDPDGNGISSALRAREPRAVQSSPTSRCDAGYGLGQGRLRRRTGRFSQSVSRDPDTAPMSGEVPGARLQGGYPNPFIPRLRFASHWPRRRRCTCPSTTWPDGACASSWPANAAYWAA